MTDFRLLPLLWLAAALSLSNGTIASAQEPHQAPAAAVRLEPVKTDSPRDAMRSFMSAMDRHVLAKHSGDGMADAWLADAAQCLDLSQANLVGREVIGREAAVLIKEVIDRVIVIDYDLVPDDPSSQRWRLRGTGIAIRRIAEGERAGEHLFSADTVSRARDYFQKVRDLPLLEGRLGGGFTVAWQERWVPATLKPEVLGVTYWQWLAIGGLVFVGLLMRLLVRALGFVARRLTQRTRVNWDDELVVSLTGPLTHLGTTGIWFASLHLLGIGGTAYTVIAFLIKGAFFINLAYLAYVLAGFVGAQMERKLRQHQEFNQGLIRLLRQTMKLVALILCLLLGAQNMGMDVASLIAGLGIGGLAFALAAKDTLANLLGSMMIMLDRPFQVGDWIVAKGVEGTVEQIGFRSTRIRTFYNSVISIPNSELVLANIDNMGMREFRRVMTTLSLTYDTPPERIEAFCEGIKNIILANPTTRKDYIQVCFSAYGAASLDILVYFFLRVPTWPEELVQRQHIYLEILRFAEHLGVRFAFPTQTLHIESVPGQPAPAVEAREADQLRSMPAAFGPQGPLSRPHGAGLFRPRHQMV